MVSETFVGQDPKHPPEMVCADPNCWVCKGKSATILSRTIASHVEADRKLLENLSDREAQIADAATRLAYDRCGNWLSDKQAKSEQFPGGDLAAAKGRAAAYQNAAQEFYYWSIKHGEER